MTDRVGVLNVVRGRVIPGHASSGCGQEGRGREEAWPARVVGSGGSDNIDI